MISVACGSFFSRNSSSLVVSYLVILPLAIAGVLFWQSLSNFGTTRFNLAITVIPGIAAAIVIFLFYIVSARMLYPRDMGSEGKEVIDPEQEAEEAIGLVIQRDQFPDRLFAPPKRSEIFGQGTLMLRLAIQISMLLAIPMMAVFLYICKDLAPWYISYVILFNILIGPVFSAGSVTSERERQTLDLLLTTVITPWQILWGKLLSSLRVSSVLSCFLLWPLLLAIPLVPDYLANFPTMVGYLIIFCLTCLTTSVLGLFCSTIFKKTLTSLIATYSIILLLYLTPLATSYFAYEYFPDAKATPAVFASTVTSPFAASFAIPLYVDDFHNMTFNWQQRGRDEAGIFGYPWTDLAHFAGYVGFTVLFNAVLLGLMVWMFNSRWRVSSSDSD